MNSPCGKPQGITSAPLRFADNKEFPVTEERPCGKPQGILKLKRILPVAYLPARQARRGLHATTGRERKTIA